MNRITPTIEWVKDTPKIRGYHGKTLLMNGKAYIMQVREEGPSGERNPGHVILVAALPTGGPTNN